MPTYGYNPPTNKVPVRPAGLDSLLKDDSILTQGDGEKRQKANVLGDLLGLLSRPSSASAQAVYNWTDKDPNTTFGGGFLEGLKGNSQTSYKNVLEDNFGVKNKYVSSIGGFVGDVALDPLTYVGIKATKGVGETESLLKAIQSGVPDVAAEAERIMAESPTKVGLTVAGKPIGSVKMPAQARKAVEHLLGPAEDKNLLSKMFSREAELPLGLNQMERVVETSHAAQFDTFRGQMKSLFQGLNPDEQQRVARALDKGESLPAEAVLNPDKVRPGFTTLDKHVEASRKILDDMFVEEGKLGLFTLKKDAPGNGLLPTDYVEYNPKYAYRYFKNAPGDLDTAAFKIERKVGGTDKGDFMLKRKGDVSLEEADKLGWEPVDQIAEMMDLRASKHFRTMSRGSFVRDAIDQHSIDATELAKLKDQGIKDLKWVRADSIGSPVAQGKADRYIPSFIAKAVNMAEDTFAKGSTGSQVMRLYDKALGHWKFANTAMNPGFHARNTMSDIIMNAADGVWNPQRYGQAAKIMADRKAVVDRSLGELLGETTGEVAKGSAKVKLGGKVVSSDDVWDLYGKSGAKSGLITSETQRTATDFQKKGLLNRAAKGKALIGDVADAREDWIRMAHFIDATDGILKNKGFKGSIEDAAMEAGKRVRKFNIDYGNLSTFERNVMKRVVPFYTWMRRATPLNMELMLTKPGFMALYPKGIDLTQGILGTDDGTGEQLIPEWIRSSAPVRVALAKQGSRNPIQNLLAGMLGAGDNEAAFLKTDTIAPMGSLEAPGNLIKGLLNGDPKNAAKGLIEPFAQGITPFAKAPIELTTGRQMFNGQPITDYKSWLEGQVAPGRVVAGFMDNGLQDTGVISAFTGAPFAVADGDRQESEFRRRQDINQTRKDEDKLAKLRKKFPNFDDLPEAKQEAYKRNTRMAPSKTEREQRRYLTQILGQ